MRVIPFLSHTAVTFLRGGANMSTQDVVAPVKTGLADRLPRPLDKNLYVRRIVLVRHGETDWNQRGLIQGGGFDIELNENGKEQANRAAQELVDALSDGNHNNVMVLASSHLQRAAQTADAIHRLWTSQQIPRVIMKEFGEMEFGALEGTALRGPEATHESRELFRDNNRKMTQDKHVCWPGGGESTADVEKRGLRGLEMLTKQYPESDLLVIVAHGRFNKILLASLLYGDALKQSEIEQGNTCINVIDQRKDGQYDQVVINYLEHLHRDRD